MAEYLQFAFLFLFADQRGHGSDPAQGTWCIESFFNDNMDPEILNMGETMTIRTTVSGDLDGVTPGIVIIALSADNGVVATGSSSITP